MYSTTTLVKNSKMSGKLVGTHQLLDKAARKVLAKHLPRGRFFPSSKEILQFEGARGPDGLKRKSPDDDDPSHMFGDNNGAELWQQIADHRHNLVQALKKHDEVRAAFEAAWMAHKITDSLTPAHHFPLSEAKEELMSNKEFIKIFGEPIKGIMHGRSALETARNNWLYWGAGGYMSKHVGYEYGVAMIAATLPPKSFIPDIKPSDLEDTNIEHIFDKSLELVKNLKMYDHFCQDGWTTDLALQTKEILLPEIVKVITLGWYSAVAEAYNIRPKSLSKPNRASKEPREN